MTNTKRKEFEADYWRENYDVLLETVKDKHPRQLENFKNLSSDVRSKRISKKKEDKLVEDLNKVSKKLNQSCWNKFLKKVNDKNYESGKCRIRLNKNNVTKIKKIVEKYKFACNDDLISALLDYFSSDKQLKELKENHWTEYYKSLDD